MTIEERLEAVRSELNRADESSTDPRVKFGALIIAIDYLVDVVADQQRQIERLKETHQ